MPDIHERRLINGALRRCTGACLWALWILLTPPALLPATGSQQQQAIVIDDFESGTLASWKIDSSGAGGWFVYTNGKTPPNPSESDPNIPFAVPDAPQGKFAAVTDMNGPGRRILYRDVKLDGRYTCTQRVYVNAGRSPAGYPRLRRPGNSRSDRIVAPSAPVDSWRRASAGERLRTSPAMPKPRPFPGRSICRS